MMHKAYLIFLFFGGSFLWKSSLEAQSPELASQIESLTNIFYVRPELRHPQDQIRISEGRARLSVWHELPPNPNSDQIECLAYRWLLGGRGMRLGAGASEVFRQIPQIRQLELELYELEFQVESVDGRGELQKTAQKKPYARMAIAREALENHRRSPEEWKEILWGGLSQCLETGRQLSIRKEIQW